MAAKSRRRGGGFGGSLLTVPQALPDDDEPTTAPEAGEPPGQVERERVPEPASSPEPAVGSIVAGENRDTQARDAEPAGAGDERAGRKTPPSTIRLNDSAGSALWGAYVEAKSHDPFLSYRQYASAVVLDGIAARKG